MPNSRFLNTFVPGLIILLGSSCGSPNNTIRDNLNKQNDSYTQAKFNELQPAEAIYQGKVSINQNRKSYDCTLQIKRTSQFTRDSQSQDGSESIEVPQLGGGMHFSALENLSMSELSNYSVLTEPMGGYLTVMFDSGNYNPRTLKMVLPYTVPGYSQASLGELEGSLNNGHFQGTWFAKPVGIVGTFDLVQTSGSSTTNAPSEVKVDK